MVEFEGKICDVKDDKTVDPDITLSYIEDKVQNILGHHQKRFEGGVSAENLGARFGGYGSFLPMYRRLPSIFSQSASTKEPKPFLSYPHLAGEEAVVPVQRDCSSSAPSNHESHALKISPASASDRKNSIFCPDEGSASVQKVGFPSHKSINFSDLKKVRVRIKMGQNTLEKDNAEISRLGLAFSSSSRLNGHNEADGLVTESPQILGDSLSGIFQALSDLVSFF
ncbi:hypothetical protein M569_14459 [Genlisea aurea]|uniref:Uncharacterized protein n=1 Tax=Genlisea aurea TaxID=192259 RepID=S8C120_9LAMI|nr:hypothetical protein M569_14459 [Genlisea aurea]